MEVSISYPGQYTKPEVFRQTAKTFHVGLVLSGLSSMDIFTPDGRFAESAPLDSAFLILLPPGATIDFCFSRKRENWVISCDITGLEVAEHAPYTVCRHQESSVHIPYCRSLPMTQALKIREKFLEIRERWHQGTPADRLAAEQLAGGLLAEYLGETNPSEEETVVTHFRRLIDEDVHFRCKLAELSRRAGGSDGYLRREFLKCYRIEPGEYRARRRLGRIMELLGQSSLSLKEIAAEVGMKHVTHLHLFVKARCAMTPGKLRRLHP